MKLWRWLFLWLTIATLAAWSWHKIVNYPGYVLVRVRDWQIETSLLTAVIILLVLWVIGIVLWQWARWPWGVLARRHRRLGQQRLGEGLVTMIEGCYIEAVRFLGQAARLNTLRAPSLLSLAEVFLRRGEYERALATLDQVTSIAPQAALVLRARVWRLDARSSDAVKLLTVPADAGQLSPEGWHELVLAALACGDTQRAYAALKPLKKSGVLHANHYAAMETRVLVAVIHATPHAKALSALWSRWPRAQRHLPEVIKAYTDCAIRFNLKRAAINELESALNRQWSPALVACWGKLVGDHAQSSLRSAEAWLKRHPDDPVLLQVSGRLCGHLQWWGKAQHYLECALALSSDVATWQTLGDIYANQGELKRAQHCYRQALIVAGYDAALQPTGTGDAGDITRAITVEQRDDQGIPHLPE